LKLKEANISNLFAGETIKLGKLKSSTSVNQFIVVVILDTKTALALLAILSSNYLKQAQFNAVDYQIDKSGPGGI
jgi:hypothetical protein